MTTTPPDAGDDSRVLLDDVRRALDASRQALERSRAGEHRESFADLSRALTAVEDRVNEIADHALRRVRVTILGAALLIVILSLAISAWTVSHLRERLSSVELSRDAFAPVVDQLQDVGARADRLGLAVGELDKKVDALARSTTEEIHKSLAPAGQPPLAEQLAAVRAQTDKLPDLQKQLREDDARAGERLAPLLAALDPKAPGSLAARFDESAARSAALASLFDPARPDNLPGKVDAIAARLGAVERSVEAARTTDISAPKLDAITAQLTRMEAAPADPKRFEAALTPLISPVVTRLAELSTKLDTLLERTKPQAPPPTPPPGRQ